MVRGGVAGSLKHDASVMQSKALPTMVTSILDESGRGTETGRIDFVQLPNQEKDIGMGPVFCFRDVASSGRPEVDVFMPGRSCCFPEFGGLKYAGWRTRSMTARWINHGICYLFIGWSRSTCIPRCWAKRSYTTVSTGLLSRKSPTSPALQLHGWIGTSSTEKKLTQEQKALLMMRSAHRT